MDGKHFEENTEDIDKESNHMEKNVAAEQKSKKNILRTKEFLDKVLVTGVWKGRRRITWELRLQKCGRDGRKESLRSGMIM